MSQSGREVDRPFRKEGLERVLELVNQAIRVVDDVGDHPDLGARLSELADAVKEEVASLK